MGKTYKNVVSGSQSTSYKSDHSRNTLGTQKKSSRRKIRNNNKICDEDNIMKCSDIKHKIKDHWASSYIGGYNNIPNYSLHSKKMEDILKCETHKLHPNGGSENNFYFEKSKWNKSGTRNEIIDKLIDENLHDDKLYWCATKKQIERRGNPKKFYGHLREKEFMV